MDNRKPGQPPDDETAAAVQIIDKAHKLFVSDPIERGDGSAIVLASDGLKLHEVAALNPLLPTFVKQSEEIVEPESFIHYLCQYGSTNTICRASLGRNRIDAVLDYHGRSRQGDVDAAVPGRASHLAALLCPFDVDYAKWRPLLTGDKLLPQREFIQFLQDLIYTVHAPPASELIEITEDLSIDRVVRFRSASNDRNGNVRFTYDEQDEGGAPHNGEFKLPESIEIIVPIFQGGNPQRLNPRLRYRMKDGQLLLGVKLAGMETTEREAFRAIGEKVRTVRKMVPWEVDGIIAQLRGSRPWESCLRSEIALPWLDAVAAGTVEPTLGAIVCTAVLGMPRNGLEIAVGFGMPPGALPNDSDRDEHANFGWPLRDVEIVMPPVPFRGKQGWGEWRRAA